MHMEGRNFYRNLRALLFNCMDRASAGLSIDSTEADCKNAVLQVYGSHLVKATVFGLYQTEAYTDREK